MLSLWWLLSVAQWDLLQANVVEREFYCTSGAIQKGVPTEVFLLSRVFVSWAETPAGKRTHTVDTLASLSERALSGDQFHYLRSVFDICFFPHKHQSGKSDDLWRGKQYTVGYCSTDTWLNGSQSFHVYHWLSCHYSDKEGKQNTHSYTHRANNLQCVSPTNDRLLCITHSYVTAGDFEGHFKNNIWIQFSCKQVLSGDNVSLSLRTTCYGFKLFRSFGFI